MEQKSLQRKERFTFSQQEGKKMYLVVFRANRCDVCLSIKHISHAVNVKHERVAVWGH